MGEMAIEEFCHH